MYTLYLMIHKYTSPPTYIYWKIVTSSGSIGKDVWRSSLSSDRSFNNETLLIAVIKSHCFNLKKQTRQRFGYLHLITNKPTIFYSIVKKTQCQLMLRMRVFVLSTGRRCARRKIFVDVCFACTIDGGISRDINVRFTC